MAEKGVGRKSGSRLLGDGLNSQVPGPVPGMISDCCVFSQRQRRKLVG